MIRRVLLITLLTSLPACGLQALRQNAPDVRPDRLYVGAFLIPAMRLKADEDPGERNQGVVFDADLQNGNGSGVVLGTRYASDGDSKLQSEARVRFFHTEHRERSNGETVDNYALTGGLVFATDLVEGNNLSFGPYFGVGVGLGFLDFDFAYDDELSALFDANIGLNLEVGERLSMFVEGGIMLHGYPSETTATSAYFGVGGRIGF